MRAKNIYQIVRSKQLSTVLLGRTITKVKYFKEEGKAKIYISLDKDGELEIDSPQSIAMNVSLKRRLR